jgi:hypothetical protein
MQMSLSAHPVLAVARSPKGALVRGLGPPRIPRQQAPGGRCWILVCKRRSALRLRAALVADAQRAARLMHSAARSMP